MALSALVVVIAAGVSGIVTVVSYVQCVDAAREAVRLAARGDIAAAEAAVHSVGPPGAHLQLGTDTRYVTATVTVTSPMLSLTLRAHAVAATEYGLPESMPAGPVR